MTHALYEPEPNELLERVFPAEQCQRVLTSQLAWACRPVEMRWDSGPRFAPEHQ